MQPAGAYHRFSPDSGNYTKAMRLFKEVFYLMQNPVWTAVNRSPSSDVLHERVSYVQSQSRQAGDDSNAMERDEWK